MEITVRAVTHKKEIKTNLKEVKLFTDDSDPTYIKSQCTHPPTQNSIKTNKQF
jgi:hypothetical protein